MKDKVFYHFSNNGEDFSCLFHTSTYFWNKMWDGLEIVDYTNTKLVTAHLWNDEIRNAKSEM